MEWKAVSSQEPAQTPEEVEQPDEHGLCWRETEIGVLAFKTNEDGSKMWIQFDSEGNGTEVVFDPEGNAYYVHGNATIPVKMQSPHTPNDSQHTQGEQQNQHCEATAAQQTATTPLSEAVAAETTGAAADADPNATAAVAAAAAAAASQETFGRGTTTSQIELLTEKEERLWSPQQEEAATEAATAAAAAENTASGALGVHVETESANNAAAAAAEEAQYSSSRKTEAALHPQTLLALTTADGDSTRDSLERQPMPLPTLISAADKPAGGAAALLSLWLEAKDSKERRSSSSRGNPKQQQQQQQLLLQQQMLLRLQGLEIPQRLAKLSEEEKIVAEAFERNLKALNEEIDFTRSVVSTAEQVR
ncbi:hypothetical protein, conserved [Eimeria acervulina]|uniref:Uncharacterized protein n=1 Tax=Eimeria acervulina TaxID=5801 RepID=U6GQ21_EIMAC|nr:hypothetical protein, conserved [Eimeria acervulina]CDI81657.1 hypothetical protein, conserved [Eimeria acervulina]